MHNSLTPKSNLLIISVWAIVVLVFLFGYAYPNKSPILGIGICFGIVAGVLQLFAIREKKEQFLAATSALEVRTAMTASKAGLFSIYIHWAAGVAVLLVALTLRKSVLLGSLAGYAAFAFVRDSIAFRGCLKLQNSTTK